jgi:fucose permease
MNNMMTALLVIIYMSFISLGLPDSILGAAWPVMSVELGAPLSMAGVLAMVVAGGTIASSLLSERVIRRFGTGLVTACSVMLTAVALLGIAISQSLVWLFVLAIPMGLGAGSVDAALNNYVALHYKAKHMNWLHCFWGVGATTGPIIMAAYIARQGGWKLGYTTIGIIQAVLDVILFATLPLWRKASSDGEHTEEHHQNSQKIFSAVKAPGVKSAMLVFFAYCAFEGTAGLWGSSYLVSVKGLSPETAAQWISLYYLGITAGRFISGFISMKLSNTSMIRLGMVIIGVGLLGILLPLGNAVLQVGFVMIGLGCAPIFPSMLHETPTRFGKSVSQKLVGLQMASAYVGATLMPPAFGAIAQYIDMSLFPFFLLLMLLIMLVLSENLNHAVSKNIQKAPCD